MTYASGTTVTVRRSREEIEELLLKHEAERIGFVMEARVASVGFTIDGWSVRFKVQLPSDDEAKEKAPRGRYNWQEPPKSNRDAWVARTERERWRALLLCIKAKLVSVESGVESFEQAFMAHLVLPGGRTVGEEQLPQLQQHVRQLPAGSAP